MTYALYWRSVGRVLALHVYVWDDGSVHPGFSGPTKARDATRAAQEGLD